MLGLAREYFPETREEYVKSRRWHDSLNEYNIFDKPDVSELT